MCRNSWDRNRAKKASDLDGGSLFRVERVEKLLFIFVERKNGAQHQQLDAAAFQQLNLIIVRHSAKRRHLFARHPQPAH